MTQCPAFEIRSTEWIYSHQSEEWQTPQLRDQFTIVYVRQGRLFHCIDKGRYEVQKMLYGITPGCCHQLLPEQDTDGYILFFDAGCIDGVNIVDLFADTGIFQPWPRDLLPDIDGEATRDLEGIFQKLSSDFDCFYPDRLEIMIGFLKILLTYLLYHKKKNNTHCLTGKSNITRRFFMLLNRDYGSKRMVSEYATEMALSPSYLNEIIKKTSGNPASYHIQQRIVSEAKRQATHNGLTLKETAYLLGFDDPSHFSKYFKNATGASFSDFRKAQSPGYLFTI